MKAENVTSQNAIGSEKNKHREPFVHIVKRSKIGIPMGIAIRAIAIVAALIVCGLLTVVMTGDNPLSVYATFVKGAFGTTRSVWVTFQNIAILLGISLAVTPAFKMRFWNTGAEGQVLIGGLATAICMLTLGGKVPEAVLIVIMILSSIAAGALWGFIPAVFKAFWNTNETLFTLMMNYVAIQLIEFFLMKADPTKSNRLELLHGRFPFLFGQQYLLAIVVAVVLTLGMFIYLKFSKHGYEISVVGESEKTARYIGINVKKVIIRTMILSGAICGIIGLLLVGGTDYTIKATTAGGRGFTAIMVSWLAKFDPLMMILTSALIVFLSRGAGEVSTIFGLNSSFSDILTGIILFFIIGCEFFINYRIVFNSKKKNEEMTQNNEETKSADTKTTEEKEEN